MHKFSLSCLGVGDGWPSARNHSAFLYRIDQTAFVIDCGEPIGRSLHSAGLDGNALDSIILSHLHFDHVGGFFMLLQGLWLKERTKALPVYLPRDGTAPMRQMLDAACIFDELLSFRLEFKPLSPKAGIQIGTVNVTPFLTTHLDSFRRRFQTQYRQEYAAYCFLIQAGPIRIGHSADIGAPEDLLPILEQPLDLLVCELAHVDPEQLFAFLKGRQIKRLVFVHLTERDFGQVEKLRREAEAQLGPMQISFAKDGDEMVF